MPNRKKYLLKIGGSFLIGSVVLVMLSFFQKILAGVNPFMLKGYLVAVLFGGTSGAILRIYVAKVNNLNITRRKDAEKALYHSKQRFKGVFDRMSSGVAIYRAVDDGTDFKFVGFNQAGQNIDNKCLDDVLGKKVTEVFPGVEEFGILDFFKRVYKTGVSEDHPVTVYRDQNLEGWRENHIFKLLSGEIVAVYDNITERKQAEENLLRLQKLESLGVLAGGIAHDFNNLLAGIMGNTSIALLNKDDPKKQKQLLEKVVKASEKATRREMRDGEMRDVHK